MRLLAATLLSLMLTACGQSGALYFAKPDNAKAEKGSPAEAPAKSTDKESIDKESTEDSDATTGP